MKIPIMRGVIDRRILVNWRIEPEALRRVLPEPFAPMLTSDRRWGIAGVCLIRLRHLRPRGFPVAMGVSSENAAHRIAVQWTEPATGAVRQGVYIPRRDSSSRLNALVGGRLFPGIHHHARFDVDETDERLRVAMQSDDGEVRLRVCGHLAQKLPPGSVFASLPDASAFFEAGSLGYSPAGRRGRYEGLELKTFNWSVRPLEIEEAASSFFDDPARFAAGSATFDCALLMRGIEHEWLGRGVLSADPAICAEACAGVAAAT
jgi:hypothetical protein